MKNILGGIFTGLGTSAIVLLVGALIVLVIFWPLLVVWALNTIFGLTIAYSFKTWLAILILTMTIRSTTTVKKS